MADIVLVHPNRDKAESKATKAVVILLLVVSAGADPRGHHRWLVAAPGRADRVVRLRRLYLVMAFFVARWNRGVLPVAAALAILFAVIAAVAGPAWFDRDKAGFDQATLDSAVLGMLTLIIVPVQLLLAAFAMRGFQQQWNVEVEVPREEPDGYGQMQPA